MLIPDNEMSTILKEQRKMVAHLTKNNIESNAYREKGKVKDALVDKKRISRPSGEDYNQWRSDISINNYLLNQNTEELKASIPSNLEKLNEIRKNRK